MALRATKAGDGPLRERSWRGNEDALWGQPFRAAAALLGGVPALVSNASSTECSMALPATNGDEDRRLLTRAVPCETLTRNRDRQKV